MLDSHFYSLVLHRLPDTGAATYQRLVSSFGSPRLALEQAVTRLQDYLSANALDALREFQHSPETSELGRRARADVDWLGAQADASLLAFEDSNYPDLLREIPKAPPLLFVRGSVGCLNLPQLAIVGSRNPSGGGLENAARFAEYLAASGFAITSGLAAGIDGAAHQGALTAGGITIAVMGTGIDLVYPARHRALAQRILESGGALVSELPLGSGSKAAHFPQRNRIISGLSCGVLVVEAALQSGSLITAHTALQQNREIFAIPGSIHNPLARGCHQLIRQGATLVETGKDIVEQLQGILAYQRASADKLAQVCSPSKPRSKAVKDSDKAGKSSLDAEALAQLSPAEQQLMASLGFDPVELDDLAERTGTPVGSLAAQLIGLEIKGFIQQQGSAYLRV
jgi:DNA processing protein